MKLVFSVIVMWVIGTTTMPIPGHSDPASPSSALGPPTAAASRPRAARRGPAEPESGISIVESGTMVLASMGLLALGAAVRRRRH